MLGLPDAFDAAMYERLLNGRNPFDGEKLTARLKSNRRLGWDVTLTDQKDVAVLELVAGDGRIRGLREDAMNTPSGGWRNRSRCASGRAEGTRIARPAYRSVWPSRTKPTGCASRTGISTSVWPT